MADNLDPKTGEPKVESTKTGGDTKSPLDLKIADLMKDPDAIKQLIQERSHLLDETQKLQSDRIKAEKAKKDADDKVLTDQGKFKELAESEKTEKEKILSRFTKKLVDLTLKTEAIALNSIDPDLVVLAVDRAGIKISEDLESVEGAKEAVAALAKAKPHLFEEVGKIPPPWTPKPHLKGILQPAAGESVLDRITRGLEGKKR